MQIRHKYACNIVKQCGYDPAKVKYFKVPLILRDEWSKRRDISHANLDLNVWLEQAQAVEKLSYCIFKSPVLHLLI